MSKTKEREHYDPTALKVDFPALVTGMMLLENGTLYAYVTDYKAQTKLRGLELTGRWVQGGYGVSDNGSYFVRFAQRKASE